jgi:integrase
MPKTRRSRKIPIHPNLAALLGTMTKHNRPYVFCARATLDAHQGDQPINVKDLNGDFQVLAKSLGMAVGRKHDGLVFHSLRHFFETAAVNAGVPQFVVDAWMGHVGEDTTGRQYYGLTDAKSKEFMATVQF